jgi:hypothetical protein
MGRLTLVALRVVLAMVLAGSLFVQAVMVPLLAIDLKEDFDPSLADVRLPVIVIVVLGIVTVQVTAVCVWRLLTMVRRGTVFSQGAFRFVDVMFGAAAVAALLTFALGVVLAPGLSRAPGEGRVGGGAAALGAARGPPNLEQRMLLAQAVARDAQAQHLQSELDEVI